MPSGFHKNPESQTNEEWLEDYISSSGDIDNQPQVPSWRNRNNDDSNHLFRYVYHRTTSTGSAVLEFESLDRGFRGVRFFNVSLIGKRGKRYPAKLGGQCNPPEHGAFRRFWLQAVGKPPYRWSTVHKQMRSSFRGIVFLGKIKHERDSKGRPYIKIIEIWPK